MVESSAPPHSRTPVTGDAPSPGILLACGLGVGIAGNLLLRAPGEPGLNLLLLFWAIALAVAILSRTGHLRPSAEAVAWFTVGVLLITGMVLRASPSLRVAALLSAAAAFAFPALRAMAGWARESGVSDYVEAVVGAMAASAFGAFTLLGSVFGLTRTGGGSGTESPRPAGIGRVALGLLLAIPLLIVFGALFMSADRLFSTFATGLVDGVKLENLVSHLVITALLTWFTLGYLTGLRRGTRLRGRMVPEIPRPSLGMVEVGIALGAVNLLFTAFVVVQLRYLFGGSRLVEVTPGLTYAEYAREGFGQLVLATSLVLALLLVADWALRRETPRSERVFRLLGGVQLLLLAVVIASAVHRLRAYVDAYGLTESRFYGGVFLGWLTFLALWLAVTVLRGNRTRFAFPALVSALLLIVTLFALNPDARIARANLERADSMSTDGSIDVAHLASLSGDAVPTLMDALPLLPPADRCTLAAGLLRRWDGGTTPDWRGWNAGEARARRLVREGRAALEAAATGEECPPLAEPSVHDANSLASSSLP